MRRLVLAAVCIAMILLAFAGASSASVMPSDKFSALQADYASATKLGSGFMAKAFGSCQRHKGIAAARCVAKAWKPVHASFQTLINAIDTDESLEASDQSDAGNACWETFTPASTDFWNAADDAEGAASYLDWSRPLVKQAKAKRSLYLSDMKKTAADMQALFTACG